MNPVDFAVIIILIVGFVWGFTKGFVYMIFSLLAILAGLFGAAKLVPLILPVLFGGQNAQVASIILFMIIFTLIYFIIRKLSTYIEDLIEFLEMEWLDSLLGGVIGLFQIIIILGILVTLLANTGFIKLIPNYTNLQVSYFLSTLSSHIIEFIAGNINTKAILPRI